MELPIFDATAMLVVLASIFGLLNHHVVKLPFAVGMMVSSMLASVGVVLVDSLAPGLALEAAFQDVLGNVDFTEALLRGMIGFLLFAGSLHTDFDGLWEEKGPILALSTVGLLMSTGILAVASFNLFWILGVEVPFMTCLLFGALISPTDPVAVLGIIRAAGATEEIEIEIVGESLFNDGFAVVLFSVLLTVATGGHGHGASVGPSMVLGLLAKEVVGGVGLGLAFGYLGYLALKTLDAPDLELLISLAIVMAISSVAFQFHFSAPLGSVVAGLLIGNRGRRFAMSDPTRRHLDIVWNFIEESLNGILFLLIGLKFVSIPLDVSAIGAGLILAPLVVAARFAAVGSLLSIPTLGEDLPLGARRILTWGGLKGGISIALAMSIPDLPGRDAVLTVTYMAVVFSIAVQGLSVGKLIEFVGDDRAPVGGDA